MVNKKLVSIKTNNEIKSINITLRSTSAEIGRAISRETNPDCPVTNSRIFNKYRKQATLSQSLAHNGGHQLRILRLLATGRPRRHVPPRLQELDVRAARLSHWCRPRHNHVRQFDAESACLYARYAASAQRHAVAHLSVLSADRAHRSAGDARWPATTAARGHWCAESCDTVEGRNNRRRCLRSAVRV